MPLASVRGAHLALGRDGEFDIEALEVFDHLAMGRIWISEAEKPAGLRHRDAVKEKRFGLFCSVIAPCREQLSQRLFLRSRLGQHCGLADPGGAGDQQDKTCVVLLSRPHTAQQLSKGVNYP